MLGCLGIRGASGREAASLQPYIPLLFLQGGNDKLAERSLIEYLAKELGSRASLRVFDYADHSFHVPVRSGRNDQEVMRDLLDALVAWIEELN